MGLLDFLFGARTQAPPTPAVARQLDDGHFVLEGHDAAVNAVAFALGGALLLTGDEVGRVIAWRTGDFQRHVDLAMKPPAPVYAFAAGERDVYFGRGKSVKQWRTGPTFLEDLRAFESFTLGEHAKEVVPVLFMARGVVTGGYDGGLKIWDTETGSAWSGTMPSPILSLACTGGLRHSVDANGFLAVGREDGQVMMFDVADDVQPLGQFRAHARDVYAVSFQNALVRRKMILATASPADRVVRLWSGPDTIAELPASGFAVTFSPDGRWLAHGDLRDVVLRDGVELREARRLVGPSKPPLSIAFTPTRTLDDAWSGWIAAASGERQVHVWKG